MSRYDELFDELAMNNSVFATKSALDRLVEPDEIVPRADQERALATILTGVTEGYLPATISVYGPPGTGKTLTTRRLCREFATRHAEFGDRSMGSTSRSGRRRHSIRMVARAYIGWLRRRVQWS